MTPNESTPRIQPGSRRDIGFMADGITRLLGIATGSEPPNLFTTLARHRGMFLPWLRFAGKLMPGGTLPRRETELVILRVADRMDCAYEWHHHARLGAQAGLTSKEILQVQRHGNVDEWDPVTAMVLRAVDELATDGVIGDETWTALRSDHSEAQLIELIMLVGHYEMLAKTINTLRIETDPPPSRPVPKVVARIEAVLSRRQAPTSPTRNTPS